MKIAPRVFRSLAWGIHAPGGCVLWWLIKPTKHLHILRMLSFEQFDEHDLATEMKTQEADIGIGVDEQGILRKLGVSVVAYTVGSPEIVSNPGGAFDFSSNAGDAGKRQNCADAGA